MIRKYVLPLVALGLLVFAIAFVVRSRSSRPAVAPPVDPPRSPFARCVAGAGIVEARTENISIGSPASGIVVEVLVRVSEQVPAGAPLFRIDDRATQAELKVREAALAVARAELTRVENLPRKEEVAVRETQVQQAESSVAAAEDKFRRLAALLKQDAITEEEFVAAEQEQNLARAKLAQARAELDLLEAGAWEYEKEQARAAVTRAAAERDEAQTEVELRTVRAPVDGEVLQVNVRPGEYVATFAAQTLIVLGNTGQLHVRVDIDENDIPRLRRGAAAVGMFKGRSDQSFPLSFVRVHPFVIPKKSLTGESTERVDTRVLQVIYAIDTKHQTFYAGQQLDVFIDAGPVRSRMPTSDSEPREPAEEEKQ